MQLPACCLSAPCWIHSFISCMRSLQTSVSCPWFLWNSHHQFRSILCGGACNGTSGRRMSQWRVKISILHRVRGVRLLRETYGSTIFFSNSIEDIGFDKGRSRSCFILSFFPLIVFVFCFISHHIVDCGEGSCDFPHIVCQRRWEATNFLVEGTYL